MMPQETIYSQWKEYRRDIPVSEDFADSIMAEIELLKHKKPISPDVELADFSSRLMSWATAAGLIMLGLFRMLYVATSLLRAHSLMPY